MENFKAPDAFSFDGLNVAQRWTRWQKQFQMYFTACELGKKSKEVQVAILLHSAGPEAQEIHEQFQFTEDGDKKEYLKILEKFGDYCKPRKNVVYERYRFWSRNQQEDEPVDKWVKDLKTIAVDCEFKDQENSMIRDKLVFGICDGRIKERMLREADLSLQKALDICRAAESTKSQMKEMTQPDATSISEVKTARTNMGPRKGPPGEEKRSCYICGVQGHLSPDCPRNDNSSHSKRRQEDSNSRQTCYNCGGIGHFSRECPSGDSFPRGRQKPRGRGRGIRGRVSGQGRRTIHELEEEDGLAEYVSEFQSLSLHTVRVNTLNAASRKQVRKRFVRFRFHKPKVGRVKEARLKVDTGAEADLMPLRKYRELFPENLDEDGLPRKCFLERSNAVLEAYGGTVIKHIGLVHLPCEYDGRKFMCDFYISDVEGPILLGLNTAEALGIVKIHIVDEITVPKDNKLYISNDVPINERPLIRNKEDLKAMYPECFDARNKYFQDYSYEIKLDPNIKPVVHAQRRLPLELKHRVKRKLEAMERDEILAKVNEPTEWVNSLLVETKTDNSLRICLDPTDLNRAIKREHYPVPVLDDIVPELAGSNLFTKLDAKDGYWHVKLDETSSFLTTFNTPFGRYRYLRMPFGLRMSQDVFQRKIDEVYGPCNGAIGIADDVTVHGNGDAEHDLRLHDAMEHTRQANMCLNYDKITVKQPSVKFFGNIYSADGVMSDPDKVAAIQALRPPETKTELRTFLGMINYLQQFIPRLSENTAPLREMNKEGVTFMWNETYQKVFEDIKELVRQDIVLAYYDRKKPVTVQCDYSKQGLGVALVQNGRPVQFASKAISGSEADYAPIEGEMLAVLYGVTKFHNYLYGRRFEVESDHKPLEHIQKKNLSRAPPRLRKMLMKLSQYDYDIHYKCGKDMVLPDTFSRLSQADQGEIPGLKVKIHSLVNVSKSRLGRLRQETENDVVLQKLKKVFEEGWPSSIKGLGADLKPYWAIRDDISVIDGLLMAGSRIIIPEISRQNVLENIHEGHQGEIKCTLRAKEAVYWPGMYKEVVEMVKNCGACREFENALPKCPMIEVEVPKQPWHTVGADLFHYKGKWNLLVTDYYSKAPFVRPVPNTGADASIRAMKGIFAENGIPCKVVSDNGPHFSADAFDRFAVKWGFELILSSPEYPRGHALIERHVQTIKKCMKKCDVSGYDFDLAMLALRCTPLDSHLPSPVELLHGRRFRTTIPTVVKDPPQSSIVKQRLDDKQKLGAGYYNRTTKQKPNLVPGQPVRLYNNDTRKWEPAMITDKAATPRSYIVQRMSGGIPLRRNRQHLKSTIETWNKSHLNESEAYDDCLNGETTYTETDGSSGTSSLGTHTEPEVPLTSSPRPVRARKQTVFYQAS